MSRKAFQTGVLTQKDLMNTPGYPHNGDYVIGPIAIIECIEQIPCDPCASFCPVGAIQIKGNLNQLPQLLPQKCSGCGICVSKCPGQAIFIVDRHYNNSEAAISFVFEFVPLPKVGEEITAVDRKGITVCQGTVVKINNKEINDHSPVVTITIPKKYSDTVRGIKRPL